MKKFILLTAVMLVGLCSFAQNTTYVPYAPATGWIQYGDPRPGGGSNQMVTIHWTDPLGVTHIDNVGCDALSLTAIQINFNQMQPGQYFIVTLNKEAVADPATKTYRTNGALFIVGVGSNIQSVQLPAK